MKSTFAKSPHRSPSYTKFATPLVLDPPRHCDLGTILLSWGKHLLGAAHDCSVRVRVEDVEPHHALIVVSEHRTVVKALDPRTWVNEGPVSEMALRPGDRLSIGPLTFRVRAADSDELAAIAAVNERTFDDDGSRDVTAVFESPAKSASVAAITRETRQTVEATPVAVAMPPVVDSASTKVVGSAVATPIESPKVVGDVVATRPVDSGPIAPLSSSAEQPAPAATAPANKPARADERPATRSTPTAMLDLRLDEIEQKLAELQQPVSARSTSTDEATAGTEALVAERRQLILRQDELQQRADELARQSQQLHERVARVAEREADVERSQARLALEHEQLSATAEVTRKELDDEYARHMALWQEWDSAYRRTSGELNGQLQSMEQRRTALLAEGDRLAGERSELQCLQAEHERDRRVHAAERVQLMTDRAALQSLRAEFDTERQQHLVAVQEREAQVAAERRAMSVTQEELLGTRQRLERDRSEFLALRSMEALRREQELREHVELREQLDQVHARIQTEQLELNELRRVVEAERTDFTPERDAFDSQQAAIAADRAELARLRERLQQTEANLFQMQHTRMAEHAVPAAEVDSATTVQSTSLDWIIEPYKNIHTPPPIPADWRDESPLDSNTTEDAVVAQRPADILPMSGTIPTTFDSSTIAESSGDDSHRTATEAADSLTDFVRSDQDVPEASSAPRVMAPAAASHRFWEDNTLYDTSVATHSQHPAPTGFVASSNLMMSASAAASAVATPLEGVASGDEGARFPAGTSLDESPEDSSVTMWSRSLDNVAPFTSGERERIGATATATADDVPTADETLAEINRQFGVPFPTQETSPTGNAVATLPSWWSPSETAVLAPVDHQLNMDDSSQEAGSSHAIMTSELEGSTDVSDAPPAAPTDSADPLSSLRAELARMFDLPVQTTAEHNETNESADAAAIDEASYEDHDYMELTLTPTADDVASELPSEAEPIEEPDSNSLSGNEASVSSGSASSTDEASAESTDEAASGSGTEDSIEACMAKLLSRSRGGSEVSASEVKSLTNSAAFTMSSSGQTAASNDESPVRDTSFDPADRSHLTAEPKHKQDRQAVRDDLQSFRQVAHQSARSALARHTTKNLLSAVIAKSVLLGVSLLATTAFLGAPLVGMPTQLWKGLACSLATLLSATEVYRSWRQLRQWKGAGELSRKSTKKTVASSTPPSETSALEGKADATPATVTAE
ncbi:MAG: FHA domain-containing protein [Planctomycetota bacterium]